MFQTGRFPILPFLEGKSVHMRFGRLLLPGQRRLEGTFFFAPRFGQLEQLTTGMLDSGQVLDKPLIRSRAFQGFEHARKGGLGFGTLGGQVPAGCLRGCKSGFLVGEFPLEGGQGRFFFGKFDIVFPYGTDRLQALFAFPLGVFQRCSG